MSVAQRPLTGVRVVLCDADGNLFPSEEPAFVASAEVTGSPETLPALVEQLAIRLLATPPRGARPAGAARDEEMDDVADPTRPPVATVGAIVAFCLAGAAVLYGIYLIVPFLHG